MDRLTEMALERDVRRGIASPGQIERYQDAVAERERRVAQARIERELDAVGDRFKQPGRRVSR